MKISSPNPVERQREFEFQERDFQTVRELIYARAGINLKSGKQEMVYSRLARRLRALKLDSFRGYLALLEDAGAPEWEAFINAITTNLTHFFREPHHFEILARQYRNSATNRPFRVWSAAASTGEEVYSVAITLAEVGAGIAPQPSILGSDLDTNVLEHARRGIYSVDQLESLSLERRKRFFLRGTGPRQGYAKVTDRIQHGIRFKNINLTSANWGIDEQFDAVFCRNVMIYFDKQTQCTILEKLRRVLQPNGRLYVGHSENLFHAKDLYQLCDRTVYRLL